MKSHNDPQIRVVPDPDPKFAWHDDRHTAWFDEATDIPPMAWDLANFKDQYMQQWPARPWAELDKAASAMRSSGMKRSQIRIALLRSGNEFSAREISETLDRLGIDD